MSRNSLNNIAWWLIPILVIGMASCRTHRKTGKIVAASADSALSDTALLNKYAFNYTYFSARGTADVGQVNLSVSLKMKKDSIVWISVLLPLNIEAVRVMIKTDSVYMLDRLKKRCYIYGIDQVEKLYHVKLNFADIQNLFVGNLLFADRSYEQVLNMPEEKKIRYSDSDFEINSSYKPDINRIFFNALLNKASKQQAEVGYHDFDIYEGQNLARRLHLKIIDGGKEDEVDIQYTQLNSAEIVDFPFNIPSNYEQIR